MKSHLNRFTYECQVITLDLKGERKGGIKGLKEGGCCQKRLNKDPILDSMPPVKHQIILLEYLNYKRYHPSPSSFNPFFPFSDLLGSM